MKQYQAKRASATPELKGNWDGPAWGNADQLQIDCFYPGGSNHKPQTRVKMLYDATALYAIFDVRDQFVRSIHTEYDSATFTDSCAEMFLQPKKDRGYFAFEINCGGAMTLLYIEDPTRLDYRFVKYSPVSGELATKVRIYHSMPKIVEPEIKEPTNWRIEVACPLAVLEAYCGPIGDPAGQHWRGNFFKCGDETSMPHYVSWAPISGKLNFHQPAFFGDILFSRS